MRKAEQCSVKSVDISCIQANKNHAAVRVGCPRVGRFCSIALVRDGLGTGAGRIACGRLRHDRVLRRPCLRRGTPATAGWVPAWTQNGLHGRRRSRTGQAPAYSQAWSMDASGWMPGTVRGCRAYLRRRRCHATARRNRRCVQACGRAACGRPLMVASFSGLAGIQACLSLLFKFAVPISAKGRGPFPVRLHFGWSIS